MFWIPGGAFLAGSGMPDFFGPDDFMDASEVILVTINYRLGALGFLSLENDLIGGNQAMRDQILAMKWVRDHISDFGGDKNQVTIFGESAGGISVLNQLMSPLSEGLYQRLLAEIVRQLALVQGNRSIRPSAFLRRFA